MPFAIARRPKGTHGELIGAERARWNPEKSLQGTQKGALGAKICFIYGANVVKKGSMWVPSVKTEPKTIAMHPIR